MITANDQEFIDCIDNWLIPLAKVRIWMAKVVSGIL
jgi:hypothetical protein